MTTLPRFCIAAALCWFLVAGVRAQDDYYSPKPVPLDQEQQAIVGQVIDEIIAAIKPLKATHPGLEHFGEKPWFTREPGEFRYDYKITKGKPVEDGSGSAVALPGGCGMYFSLNATYTPDSKWSSYYRTLSGGGARAGIWHNFSITTGDPGRAFDRAVNNVIQGVLDTTFEKLAAEYVLRKHNVQQDTASVIAALAGDGEDVRYSAARELVTRKLAPGDFAAIRDGYAKEKFPATFGFYYMMKFLREHDEANLPDFCLAMAKTEIRIETKGRGIVKPAPFVTGPESEADTALGCLIVASTGANGKADPRFAPAALEILSGDPDEGHREQALDYFSKLSGKRRAQGIAAGLENSMNSVQIKAAQLAGGLKVAGVGKPLVALLASPNSNVRAAAREAAKKLALDIPAADPERPVPTAALAHIADTLWQSGLSEDEVVAECAQVPEKIQNVFPATPAQAAMPAGITVRPAHRNDPHNFTLILTDPWRMTKMDADSVKKRGSQFAAGFGHGDLIDPTGPYLIAAAMKLGDTATAQAVYERLCNKFKTDDDILYEGLQGLGWSRILAALDLYTHAKDDEALKAFARVIQLENHVRPRSFLAGYVKLARQVATEIERRKKEAPAPAPEFATGAECEAYWHEKFPGKKARIEAMVAQLQNGVTSEGWDHTRGESSLNIALEDEGSDAVEPLLDCLVHDDWLTRDVQEDWDHGEPVRWVTDVRGGIMNLFAKMYHKRFVTVENQAGFSEGDPAALQKIAEAVRAARDAEVKSETGK